MKKKILTLALATIIMLGITAIPTVASASSLSANPTASTVYVNGAAKAFEAYIINGNNYFKLRDLAYVLNGTAKQFEVGYDNATKAITLTTGRPYTPDGGEMARGDGRAKTASPTASRIYLDGRELNLTVYLIGGNNFFKLRDLMEALDVFVGYDNATKAITLDTSKGYVPETSTTPSTPPTSGTGTTSSPLTIDKNTYTAGETITVIVSGVTQKMVDDLAYIAIYEIGADHWGESQTRYPKLGTDTLTLTAPAFSGSYEVRLYSAVVLGDRGSAFVTSIAFSVVDKDKPTDNNAELPSNSSSIVGMWRSERYYSSSNGTVGVVFFNADGTYQSIRYRHDRFIGERGKFRLSGNNLEVYDLLRWSKADDALSFEYFSEDLTKIRDLISTGTRSELLAIIDPQNSIWQHYVGITGTGGWIEMDSWTETIEWIDATTIDYQSGMHYPYKLVS